MRLIDADAAKRKAIVCTNAAIEGDESEEMLTFMRVLQELLLLAFDEAPTVEAEPVKHGRWDFTSCSLCDHSFLEYAEADCDTSFYTGLPNYCPNCGAKMDKEG